jgi:hypothetical protein
MRDGWLRHAEPLRRRRHAAGLAGENEGIE